jgi:hypothetical protein
MDIHQMTSDSVYKTPEADLLINEELPKSFIDSNFSYKKLKYLAWLSVIYLIATIPLLGLSFMSGAAPENNSYIVLGNILDVIVSMIYVYLLYMFKKLINSRLECHSADRYIYILIGLSVIMPILTIFMTNDDLEFNIISITFFVMLVPLGIVSILFGVRLLKQKSDFKYLKLYSWSTIIMGVMLASVVLFLLALPVGIVSSFAMAMMYFTAAKELKSIR